MRPTKSRINAGIKRSFDLGATDGGVWLVYCWEHGDVVLGTIGDFSTPKLSGYYPIVIGQDTLSALLIAKEIGKPVTVELKKFRVTKDGKGLRVSVYGAGGEMRPKTLEKALRYDTCLLYTSPSPRD